MAQTKEQNHAPAAANASGEKRPRTSRRPHYTRRPRRPQQPKEAATPIHIYPLGGLGEVGKNMTVYECCGDMIIVDCGLVFPDNDMFGVDMVIPDFTFVVQNKDKIKGLLITHGHEDHIGSIQTIGDRFTIKSELPDAVVPALDWEAIRELFPVAITIAVLGAIESLLSATVADGVIGDRHDSNTELIAQGAANIIAPLFGGIPATGAIARTMTNINNGGKTPIAGIIHAVVLLLILLFLMPLAQYIPMACLAGVLVIVSYNMSGWRVFRALLKNPKSDVTVLLITFFLTVIFDLTVAIEVGLVIACVLFMKRVMETTEISVITDEIDPNKESDIAVHEENLMIPKGIEVYEINGPYFFGIATKFEETMTQLGDRPKVRIIRMRKVPFIDSTGIHNLTTLCEMSQKEKTTVILSGVNENVHNVLEKAGFYELLGKENICPNINVALERAKSLVK